MSKKEKRKANTLLPLEQQLTEDAVVQPGKKKVGKSRRRQAEDEVCVYTYAGTRFTED